MAYTERNGTDLVIGSGHPKYADTKNSACIELYTLLEVEHTDGMHDDRNYAMTGEIDTFTGDGNTTQTITLSNSDLTPRMLLVWRDAGTYPHVKFSSMGTDECCMRYSTSFVDRIGWDVGEFTVKHSSLNANGVTYYYLMLGIDVTSEYSYVGGANDPDWVEDAELGSADGTGTSVCDKVEEAIDTGIDAGHNGTTGVHDTPPFSGFARIECGSYTGDGNDSRDISLADSDMDIQYLLIVSDNAYPSYSRSETMAGDNTKTETLAAFSANVIQSVGTGTFQVGSANGVNQSSVVYYYCAIGV